MIAQGSVHDIQAQLQSEKVLRVKVMGDTQPVVPFFEMDPFVSQIEEQRDKNTIQFFYRGAEEDQMRMLQRAIEQKIPILSFSEEETDLEDVFMAITKGVEIG